MAEARDTYLIIHLVEFYKDRIGQGVDCNAFFTHADIVIYTSLEIYLFLTLSIRYAVQGITTSFHLVSKFNMYDNICEPVEEPRVARIWNIRSKL